MIFSVLLYARTPTDFVIDITFCLVFWQCGYRSCLDQFVFEDVSTRRRGVWLLLSDNVTQNGSVVSAMVHSRSLDTRHHGSLVTITSW